MWNNKNLRLILGLLGLLVLIYIVWNVRLIIVYFFIATIIAFVARPLMALLSKVHINKWRLPSWSKASIVLLALVMIFAGIFRMIIPTVLHQADIISKIDSGLLLDRIQPGMDNLYHWMDQAKLDPEELEQSALNEISKLFSINDLGGFFSDLLGGLADTLIAIFSILFISFFLLKDGRIVDNVISSLSPDKYLEKIRVIINDTKNLLSRYFIGIIAQVSIVMIVISLGLSLVGVENALFIGLLAGIFNIIPYVGPLLGGSLGWILAMTAQLEVDPELNLLSFGALALLPFVVAQLLDNFVLQPLIFSKSVKAHPLEIFIVILAAGSLAGVLGMIIAVPVYSFLRIVAREFFNGYKIVQGLTKNI